MKSSLKSPTKAELRRFYILKFEIGCLFHPGTPAEAHHLLSGGKRISHMATIPLCPLCHWEIHNRKRDFFSRHAVTHEYMLKLTDAAVAAIEAGIVG